MSEWGPWIEHDGASKPLQPGMLVIWRAWCGVTFGPGCVRAPSPTGWSLQVWATLPAWLYPMRVVRYRIRKPRALEHLREIARNPERELEDV